MEFVEKLVSETVRTTLTLPVIASMIGYFLYPELKNTAPIPAAMATGAIFIAFFHPDWLRRLTYRLIIRNH